VKVKNGTFKGRNWGKVGGNWGLKSNAGCFFVLGREGQKRVLGGRFHGKGLA